MAVETIGGAPSQVTAATTDSCVMRVITKETIWYWLWVYKHWTETCICKHELYPKH